MVVNSGAPVEMPWADDVDGIVQIWYAGQEGGAGLADVLFGDVDASGRLPTSFPVRLEDTPAFPFYPGDGQTLQYGEGMYVGYRYYDTRGVVPRFCFGHGLSYTTFSYGDLSLGRNGTDMVVEVDVANIGERRGADVVQVYVRRPRSGVERPDKELKAFEKVWLDPGESRRVRLSFTEQAFRHWDEHESRWESSGRRGDPRRRVVARHPAPGHDRALASPAVAPDRQERRLGRYVDSTERADRRREGRDGNRSSTPSRAKSGA